MTFAARSWLAAGFLILAAPAWAQSLDGWGALKFGMSPEQARAQKGFTFGVFGAKNIMNENHGAMASKKPVLVNGIPYSMDIYFNAFEAMNEISMWNEKTVSQADCQDRFIILLGQIEKTYGKLAPVFPEKKKIDQDTLPMSVEWKNAPGASRYQLATVFMPSETAYVWDARRLFGGRYVDAAAVWSAPHDDDQAVCLTELDFKS